jgi:WD40 repeat protein
MSKQTWVKVSGVWRPIKDVWKNVGGVWKQEVIPHIKDSGVYKACIKYISAGWATSISGQYSKSVLSPDGAYIYCGGDADEIVKIDTSNGNVVWTYTGHTGDIRSLGISPDGNYLYSGANDQYVKKINTATKVEEWSKYVDALVLALGVSPNNDYVYVSGPSDSVIQLDANTGATGWTYTGADDNVWDITVAPDNNHVYVGWGYYTHGIDQVGISDGVRDWRVTDSSRVYNVAVSSDSSYIYTGNMSGYIKKLDKLDGSIEWTKSPSSETVQDIKLSPGDERLYIGYGSMGSGDLRLVDTNYGGLIKIHTLPSGGEPYSVNINQDESKIYCSDYNGNIYQLLYS